jgi:hypothetical protein
LIFSSISIKVHCLWGKKLTVRDDKARTVE